MGIQSSSSVSGTAMAILSLVLGSGMATGGTALGDIGQGSSVDYLCPGAGNAIWTQFTAQLVQEFFQVLVILWAKRCPHIS